ncbi:hypothetical protein M5E88_14130 [Akkermansia muciniphila]|nr:hypothetical protein M5E88_14130 [Akkermansia muciniphila]
MGVMLDGDMETLKALEPYGPMMFSGLDTHPGVRKYKFRVKAPVLRAAPGAPGAALSAIGGLHGLDVGKPSLFPVKKAAPAEGAPILIAPFSRLGSASEWSREQWTELVSLLPGRTVLVALEEDRERAAALAEHLNVELAVGAPEALFSVMDGASVAVAVDGDFPSLCSFRGLPVVTLFSTRLPDVYRPMGTFNRSLYSHQCCSPASGRIVTGMSPATATLPCGKCWMLCGKFPERNNLGKGRRAFHPEDEEGDICIRFAAVDGAKARKSG